MSVIVEGKNKILIGGAASIVEEDREVAWTQPYITRQPDLKWITGNYVEADRANSNGHIFPLEDLKDSIASIPNKPLNLLHAPNRVVGAYAAAELIYPNGESADDGNELYPVVEALAAYYHYYFPETWPAIEMAHKEGQLFYSMETVPQTVTCRGKGAFEGCGQSFAYAGRQSPTYCDHLNEVASRKTLHKPHFTAGALIIPPVRPGWKHADITELSSLIEANLTEAEVAYNQIADEFPHLSPDEWEKMMAFALAAAHAPAATPVTPNLPEPKGPLGPRSKVGSDGPAPVKPVKRRKTPLKTLPKGTPAPVKADIGVNGPNQVSPSGDKTVIVKKDLAPVNPQPQTVDPTANLSLPDGSFFIANGDDLLNAIAKVQNADQANPRPQKPWYMEIKAHIAQRASQLGMTDKVPDDWQVMLAKLEARGKTSDNTVDFE